MTVVGASGGAVTSSDGKLAVSIPAGAVIGDITITTEAATAPVAGAVGAVYEIGPTGTQFAMAVTLTLHYDAGDIGATPETSLRVATFAGGSWQLLPGAIVNAQARTVSGLTTHLSPYAIVTEAAGKTCATVQAGFGCAAPGTNPGGTSTGGSGTAVCTPPTCAAATNVCSQYPGAAMEGCTDGEKGYAASCCFPAAAPICFAVGGAAAGCTATGGGTASCPSAPSCATASGACAAYPGATLQGCTDGASGYSGGCCFPPEAPVCVSMTVARACAPSPSGGSSCSSSPPRCADGPPCARYPGGTVQSCIDMTDGFQATCCFALGTLPLAGGSSSGGGTGPGGTDAGVPTTDGGSGAGGTTGGGAGATSGTDGGTAQACQQGATCQPGTRCGDGSPTSCLECTCGADGHLTCTPCPDKPDGGPGAGGTTGGGAGATSGGGGTDGGTAQSCEPGAICQPGMRCGNSSPTSCLECTCGADGHLTCTPCPDKPDGGPGAGASPGGAGATSGGGGTGGTSPGGSGATGGGATGPCEVMPMPAADLGLPCGVTELCPDGSNYRVRCDGGTGACMCIANGAMTPAMPTIACSSFDPLAALVACGFPNGKI